MFTNKNTSESLAPSSESITLVAAGTELKGDLNFSGSLEIQGSIFSKQFGSQETMDYLEFWRMVRWFRSKTTNILIPNFFIP